MDADVNTSHAVCVQCWNKYPNCYWNFLSLKKTDDFMGDFLSYCDQTYDDETALGEVSEAHE